MYEFYCASHSQQTTHMEFTSAGENLSRRRRSMLRRAHDDESVCSLVLLLQVRLESPNYRVPVMWNPILSLRQFLGCKRNHYPACCTKFHISFPSAPTFNHQNDKYSDGIILIVCNNVNHGRRIHCPRTEESWIANNKQPEWEKA
jgi:hypothetical protein